MVSDWLGHSIEEKKNICGFSASQIKWANIVALLQKELITY